MKKIEKSYLSNTKEQKRQTVPFAEDVEKSNFHDGDSITI